jgi:hypothetical protein
MELVRVWRLMRGNGHLKVIIWWRGQGEKVKNNSPSYRATDSEKARLLRWWDTVLKKEGDVKTSRKYSPSSDTAQASGPVTSAVSCGLMIWHPLLSVCSKYGQVSRQKPAERIAGLARVLHGMHRWILAQNRYFCS